MEKTFYEAQSSQEALERYLEANDTLYDRTKNDVIRRITSSLIISSLSPINPIKKRAKVLEVGAGGGIWTDFLIKSGLEVTCIDLSALILKGNRDLHPEAKFILADATTVKLKERFDLIFAKDIIEHIKDDMLFLKNMNEHLKESGLLFLNTQNSFSLNYLIEGGWYFLRGKRNWCGWDPTHIRFYTPWSLKRKLGLTGFKIVKWFGCYHLPYRFVYIFMDPKRFKLIGKVWERKIFHLPEILGLYDKPPFNITGWGLGVVAEKSEKI